MLIPLQPKSICTEGVESLKHEQEALSENLFSVVMLVQSLQEKKKKPQQQRSITAKRAGAKADSFGAPTHIAALQETGRELIPWVSAVYAAEPQALHLAES